jgi:hypothetical protein
MGTAACTNPAVGFAWAYLREVQGSSQQAYACGRCAEVAVSWLSLYVGAPARWTPLNRTDPRRADQSSPEHHRSSRRT